MEDKGNRQDENLQDENRSVQAKYDEEDQCYEMSDSDECGTEACCEMFCCCC
jgi:hypothetical protein